MDDSNWAIYDGKEVKAGEPAVAVASRGLMYGDGCFETLRMYSGSFFKLDAHLSRLQGGADFLDLEYPFKPDASTLKDLIERLLHKNELADEDAIIRIQLWREGGRGYGIDNNSTSHYALLATPLPKISPSVSLATVDTRRIPDSALPSSYKLCNNINYITAARQARAKGAEDALMQTVEGFVSETTIANLFWLNGNHIYTPSLECDLLPGITRNTLMDLIRSLTDFKINEGRYTLGDVQKSEAAFICNSVRQIVAVSEIDGQLFNTRHPVLDELQSLFKSYLKQELKD